MGTIDRGNRNLKARLNRPASRRWAEGLAATICMCWAAWCGPYDSNNWPLAFGMTPTQAASALGVPLAHYSGSAGSEILVAQAPTPLPLGWRFPADSTLALQFRRGHLTGWKENFSLRRPLIIY